MITIVYSYYLHLIHICINLYCHRIITSSIPVAPCSWWCFCCIDPTPWCTSHLVLALVYSYHRKHDPLAHACCVHGCLQLQLVLVKCTTVILWHTNWTYQPPASIPELHHIIEISAVYCNLHCIQELAHHPIRYITCTVMHCLCHWLLQINPLLLVYSYHLAGSETSSKLLR